jgi:hypothetical protein
MFDPTICIHGGLVSGTTRGAAGVVRVRLQGELDAFSQGALRHLLRRLDLHSTRHSTSTCRPSASVTAAAA